MENDIIFASHEISFKYPSSNRRSLFGKRVCFVRSVRMGLFGILKAFQVFPALFKVHCTLKMSYQKNVPAFTES